MKSKRKETRSTDVKEKKLHLGLLQCRPKGRKRAVCGTCSKFISCGGTSAKNFNTSNLQYHLQRVHINKFEELELKQEEADKKAEEYEVKQQKTDACQLTLAEVKESKDLWSYCHPQHKKVTGWVGDRLSTLFYRRRFRFPSTYE